MAGLGNIIIGVIFIGGGLSGELALLGTDSGGALALVGGGLVAWGVYQMVQSKKGEG